MGLELKAVQFKPFNSSKPFNPNHKIHFLIMNPYSLSFGLIIVSPEYVIALSWNLNYAMSWFLTASIFSFAAQCSHGRTLPDLPLDNRQQLSIHRSPSHSYESTPMKARIQT